jgi:hypothetical protein
VVLPENEMKIDKMTRRNTITPIAASEIFKMLNDYSLLMPKKQPKSLIKTLKEQHNLESELM